MVFSALKKSGSQQNWRTRGRNRFCWEGGRGHRWSKQCIHVSKYKNDKIKLKKKKGCVQIEGIFICTANRILSRYT
jgi:hypothetical protein